MARFAKGNRANPGGRPKQDPKIKEMFSKHLESAIKAVSDALAGRDMELRLKAANIVFDRVLGKPVQAMEHSGKDGTPLTPAVYIMAKPEIPE